MHDYDSSINNTDDLKIYEKSSPSYNDSDMLLMYIHGRISYEEYMSWAGGRDSAS